MTETAQQEQATGMLKWLWLSAVVFVLDQITKWLAVDAFVLYERMEILPFFNLTLAHNYGAAFSFLADHGGWQRWFFTAIAGGVSVALVIWLKRLPKNDWWIAVSLALILGGALGNVYDRVLLGYVVDFLQADDFMRLCSETSGLGLTKRDRRHDGRSGGEAYYKSRTVYAYSAQRSLKDYAFYRFVTFSLIQYV